MPCGLQVLWARGVALTLIPCRAKHFPAENLHPEVQLAISERLLKASLSVCVCVCTQLKHLSGPLRINWALGEVLPAPLLFQALLRSLPHLLPSLSPPTTSHTVPGPSSQPLARDAEMLKNSSLRVMSILGGGLEAPELRRMVEFQHLEQVLRDSLVVFCHLIS